MSPALGKIAHGVLLYLRVAIVVFYMFIVAFYMFLVVFYMFIAALQGRLWQGGRHVH